MDNILEAFMMGFRDPYNIKKTFKAFRDPIRSVIATYGLTESLAPLSWFFLPVQQSSLPITFVPPVRPSLSVESYALNPLRCSGLEAVCLW